MGQNVKRNYSKCQGTSESKSTRQRLQQGYGNYRQYDHVVLFERRKSKLRTQGLYIWRSSDEPWAESHFQKEDRVL